MMLIYPVTKENYFIIKELMCKSAKKCILSTYNNSRFLGLDFSVIFNEPYSNIYVQKVDDVDFSLVDEITLLDINTLINNDDYILKIVNELSGKTINVCDCDEVFKFDFNRSNEVKVYKSKHILDLSVIDDKCYHFNISKPIIAIGGVFEMSDNIDIAFKIRRELSKKGMRAVSLTSNFNSLLVDSIPLPLELSQPNISFPTKTQLLNTQLNRLCNLDIDLIILEVPSGLTRINNTYLNNYGEWYHILSEASGVDYYIFNAEAQFLDDEFVGYIKEHLANSHSILLESIFISNFKHIWNNEGLPSSKVEHVIVNPKLEFSASNLLVGKKDNNYITEVANDIIKKCR